MKHIGVLAISVAAVSLTACATAQSSRARLVRVFSPCLDQTAQVYFEPGSAGLTPEGRAVIEAAATSSRNCRVQAVEVVGLAEAAGQPQAALELSKRRAEAVSAALAANGLPPAEFRVLAEGQAGALAADGAKRPLRRRVDIALRLAGR